MDLEQLVILEPPTLTFIGQTCDHRNLPFWYYVIHWLKKKNPKAFIRSQIIIQDLFSFTKFQR